MKRIALGLLLIIGIAAPLFADEKEPAPAAKPVLVPPTAASPKALRTHAEWLCDIKRMGRLEWTHREACAEYIKQAFEKAGLVPLPGKTSMHDDHANEMHTKARNVVAWLPGSQAGTTAEAPGPYVIVSAHFDHLGAQTITIEEKETGVTSQTVQVMYGADDNASGTAALIDLARMLATDAKAKRLDRSVVFVAFDLEEQRLIGSNAYAESSPLPLKDCKAFVTMDQLGRSIADVAPGSLFLMGTENCSDLTAVLDALPQPKGGSKLPLGIDFQPGYSDYVPFMKRKIPYVFVTSGACSDYHTIRDTVDQLEWPHLAARTNWCRDLIAALADGTKTFTWHDEAKYHPDEMRTLRGAIKKVEEQAKSLGLPEFAVGMLKNYGGFLDKIMEDGTVTVQERTNARTTALTLFRMASQLPR